MPCPLVWQTDQDVFSVHLSRWSCKCRSLVIDGAAAATCEKGWAYADYVTRLSAGAACAEGRFSSPLACPAVCSWDASRLRQAACAGIQPPTGAGALVSCLALHVQLLHECSGTGLPTAACCVAVNDRTIHRLRAPALEADEREHEIVHMCNGEAASVLRRQQFVLGAPAMLARRHWRPHRRRRTLLLLRPCRRRSAGALQNQCHITAVAVCSQRCKWLTGHNRVQVSAHWRLPTAVIWLLVISSLLLPVRPFLTSSPTTIATHTENMTRLHYCFAPSQLGVILIRQQQRVTAAHAHGVAWGAYTVLVSWPRSVLASNDELRAFCRHYGPVRRQQRVPIPKKQQIFLWRRGCC